MALEGEINGLAGSTAGILQSFKAQFSNTDYQHTEFDGPNPGTVFKNKGTDLRLQARHAKWGNLEGAWGLQTESTRFSADGDEAFAPYSRSKSTAIFAVEELAMGWGKLSAGARLEKARVESLGS